MNLTSSVPGSAHLLFCSTQATEHPHYEGEAGIFFPGPRQLSSHVQYILLLFARHSLLTLQTCICVLAKRSWWLSMHHGEPLFSFHPLQMHIMNADASWVVDHLQVILCFPTPLLIVDPFGCFHRDPHHLVHALYVHTVGRCVCLVAMTVGASWLDKLFLTFNVVDQKSWWTSPFALLKLKHGLRIFHPPSCLSCLTVQ